MINCNCNCNNNHCTDEFIILCDGTKLYSGDIVILDGFDNKWILHTGWYTYDGKSYQGWYFSSIPEQTILPLKYASLDGIIIISTSNPCVPPASCPPTPIQPTTPFTPELEQELHKTFITVQTLAERNLLNKDELIVNGRIVKVMDIGDGTTEYYAWDQVHEEWIKEQFESEIEELNEIVVWHTIEE